jgi:aminopeptidase N
VDFFRQYGVFTGEDIWKALHHAAEEEKTISKDMCVVSIANSWITKDRLPVVTVERNYEEKTALVSQVI